MYYQDQGVGTDISYHAKLSWPAASGNGITGYRIYSGSEASHTMVVDVSAGTTSCDIGPLTTGAGYQYGVCCLVGQAEGAITWSGSRYLTRAVAETCTTDPAQTPPFTTATVDFTITHLDKNGAVVHDLDGAYWVISVNPPTYYSVTTPGANNGLTFVHDGALSFQITSVALKHGLPVGRHNAPNLDITLFDPNGTGYAGPQISEVGNNWSWYWADPGN